MTVPSALETTMRTSEAPLFSTRPQTDDSFVHYGSLNVPKSATGVFDLAVKYLQRDSIERTLIDKLENSTTSHRLVIIGDGNDSYNPNTHRISWDPYSALRTTCGGSQSPALGLGHEIDHATCDPITGERLASHYDANYDNLEEKRVITGSEAHAARTLGEDVRHDHIGSVYAVASPIAR